MLVDNIEDELMKEPLKSLMDFSNYPTSHPLFNDSHKGKLGLLKSETADDYPNECICLQAKCYSIMLNSECRKMAAKGVKRNVQQNLLHEAYRAVHEQRVKLHVEPMYSITSHNCELRTTKTIKTCLNKVELKRYYLDGDRTLGYGHPDIPQSVGNVAEVSQDRKRKIKPSVCDHELDCTYKRGKAGESVLPKPGNK